MIDALLLAEQTAVRAKTDAGDSYEGGCSLSVGGSCGRSSAAAMDGDPEVASGGSGLA
jgi:hypothetical protein